MRNPFHVKPKTVSRLVGTWQFRDGEWLVRLPATVQHNDVQAYVAKKDGSKELVHMRVVERTSRAVLARPVDNNTSCQQVPPPKKGVVSGTWAKHETGWLIRVPPTRKGKVLDVSVASKNGAVTTHRVQVVSRTNQYSLARKVTNRGSPNRGSR